MRGKSCVYAMVAGVRGGIQDCAINCSRTHVLERSVRALRGHRLLPAAGVSIANTDYDVRKFGPGRVRNRRRFRRSRPCTTPLSMKRYWYFHRRPVSGIKTGTHTGLADAWNPEGECTENRSMFRRGRTRLRTGCCSRSRRVPASLLPRPMANLMIVTMYAIEDTRRALIEAHRGVVLPCCITIDSEAKHCSPYLYDAACTVIDDAGQLPLKVSDIYRRLTSWPGAHVARSSP